MPVETTVKHCEFTDLLTGECSDAVKKAFNDYLFTFATPQEGSKCLKCGEVQGGLMAALLGTGFKYALAHGEGYCATCKWPARANHYIKDADGNEIATLSPLILQYHPDFVTERTNDEKK